MSSTVVEFGVSLKKATDVVDYDLAEQLTYLSGILFQTQRRLDATTAELRAERAAHSEASLIAMLEIEGLKEANHVLGVNLEWQGDLTQKYGDELDDARRDLALLKDSLRETRELRDRREADLLEVVDVFQGKAEAQSRLRERIEESFASFQSDVTALLAQGELLR
ncbi:hypothetical protein OG599_09150 [Streptomyces sp. NBC_01335]|uniref:hypothetical protein n=1 Tax=Streptomyces sp. NBC_01335 TaxID=2903828 RepID=UPI002E0F1A0C|nr:hypothetical protein OG599_09150 [Streptomyces sp. NBC_01335]